MRFWLLIPRVTDRTCDLALALGARVITNPWPGFSDQKQLGVDNALNDWILSIDADERVSRELRGEIESIRSNGSSVDGYRIPRLSFYAGNPDPTRRLVSRPSATTLRSE
jgi:glycosyltransferase involved in cell wall biosynthesis